MCVYLRPSVLKMVTYKPRRYYHPYVHCHQSVINQGALLLYA
jgi:hypothetical protein